MENKKIIKNKYIKYIRRCVRCVNYEIKILGKKRKFDEI
jgi:hypothetical protein